MRDALSLTDQAIAYSAGNLTEEAVRGMLGTIDQRHLVRLLDALATGDAKGRAGRGRRTGHPWPVLCRRAGGPGSAALARGDRAARDRRHAGGNPLAADISRLAQACIRTPSSCSIPSPCSRGELTLAPDEYAGFIMACLRMLALNGEAGPQTALEAPAAPARQTARLPPWPPPPLSRPAPVAAPHPQRQRSKRRLRQPRRLSSRLNPLRPRAERRPSRRKRPRPRPLPPQSGMPAAPATEESASVARGSGRAGKAGRARRARVRAGRRAAWEELPDAAPAAVQAKPGAAALAVTPAASAVTAPRRRRMNPMARRPGSMRNSLRSRRRLRAGQRLHVRSG